MKLNGNQLTIITVFAMVFIILMCCKDDDEQTVPPEDSPAEVGAIDTVWVGLNDPIYMRKYGRTLVYYAYVDKAGDYSRRMFIDSVSSVEVYKTGVLPDNAMLFLETWFGSNQSTTYIRQKRDGQWLSGSFSPPNAMLDVDLVASCNSCHATARLTDDAFTLPLLQKALSRGRVQWIECPETSFNPCELSVYQGKD